MLRKIKSKPARRFHYYKSYLYEDWHDLRVINKVNYISNIKTGDTDSIDFEVPITLNYCLDIVEGTLSEGSLFIKGDKLEDFVYLRELAFNKDSGVLTLINSY